MRPIVVPSSRAPGRISASIRFLRSQLAARGRQGDRAERQQRDREQLSRRVQRVHLAVSHGGEHDNGHVERVEQPSTSWYPAVP
jgi:hypothetical protein